MELLLWRWSTTVQVGSAIMIAAFFLALAAGARRVEVRPWIWAWVANVAAMVVTVSFWFLQPATPVFSLWLSFGYFLTKTWFVVLLLVGVVAFARRGWDPRPAARRTAIPVIVFAAVAAVATGSLDEIGVVQSLTVALVAGAGVGILAVRSVPGSAGLALGLGLRTVLGLAEAAAYATRIVVDVPEGSPISIFLASHSALDTGAEWMIVLGCVLVIYRTIQTELQASHRDLEAAHTRLQGLVDRDPLTGLVNRRGAPAVMREAFETGATVLFLDLDEFKQINDELGHHVGDAALIAFAEALRNVFRPGDRVMRFGGDEFVVIAPGARPSDVQGRLEGLADELQTRIDELGCAIRFSVGQTYMAPGSDPEEALSRADAEMYRHKGRWRSEGAAHVPL